MLFVFLLVRIQWRLGIVPCNTAGFWCCGRTASPRPKTEGWLGSRLNKFSECEKVKSVYNLFITVVVSVAWCHFFFFFSNPKPEFIGPKTGYIHQPERVLSLSLVDVGVFWVWVYFCVLFHDAGNESVVYLSVSRVGMLRLRIWMKTCITDYLFSSHHESRSIWPHTSLQPPTLAPHTALFILLNFYSNDASLFTAYTF